MNGTHKDQSLPGTRGLDHRSNAELSEWTDNPTNPPK